MTAVTMEWESRLGRRLRVRDLYILSAVVKAGSMAAAARQLRMSQPAVSEAVANLEQILRVRLLDRSPRGIQPTIYANALLKRSAAVFDELKQSVRDIEFLVDPTIGQLTIGCPESIATTVLPQILERFLQLYPRIVLHIDDVPSPAIRAPGLRERRHDLIFARWHPDNVPVDDLDMEPLFDDPFVVAAGQHTLWARRRKIALAELANERWILPPPAAWNYAWIARELKARGLGPPNASIVAINAHLNSHFLKNGQFLTVRPRSWVLGNGLAVLPVDVPLLPMPVAIVTLKNRTLSPVVERFADCAREVAKTFGRAAH
ncbi:MAG: LysR family transcriptional regulator [Pseudolabrys sp.]